MPDRALLFVAGATGLALLAAPPAPAQEPRPGAQVLTRKGDLVDAALTSDARKRLDQEYALMAEFFGFTEKQKIAIHPILVRRVSVDAKIDREYAARRYALYRSGAKPAALRESRARIQDDKRRAAAALEVQFRQQAAAILTPEQLATWDALRLYEVQSRRCAPAAPTAEQRKAIRALCVNWLTRLDADPAALAGTIDAQVLSAEQRKKVQ